MTRTERLTLAHKVIDTAREALASRAMREAANDHVDSLLDAPTPIFWAACNVYAMMDLQWLQATKRHEWTMIEFVNSFPGINREVTFGNYLAIARAIIQQAEYSK